MRIARLLHDVIAVKRRKANTIIDIVGHKEHIGEVVAVGPGKMIKNGKKEVLQVMTLQPGDKVMFSHRAGVEKKIGDDELLFMREADIICVVRDVDDIKITENANTEERGRECVGYVSSGSV